MKCVLKTVKMICLIGIFNLRESEYEQNMGVTIVIDIKKWIYSQDIADWILENVVLSTTEQIDCICTAPHRTMREKLTELKKTG